MFLDPTGYLQTAYVGKAKIGNDQITLSAGEIVDGLSSQFERRHVVTRSGEGFRQHTADIVFILDDNDPSRRALCRGGRFCFDLFHESRFVVAKRQPDFETCALAWFADQHDLTAMSRDDAV